MTKKINQREHGGTTRETELLVPDLLPIPLGFRRSAGLAHWMHLIARPSPLTRAVVPGAKMTIVAVPASDFLHGEVVQTFHGMQYSCVGSEAVEPLPAKIGLRSQLWSL
jgi:hypothetical protein